MPFNAPLLITPAGGGKYATCKSFSFDVGFKGSGLTVTVPQGYLTDLASIPRPFWWLLQPFDPQYAAAAVLHDFLLSWQSIDGDPFDHATADAIFYEAMRILGVPLWKAVLMYLAVRLWAVIPH